VTAGAPADPETADELLAKPLVRVVAGAEPLYEPPAEEEWEVRVEAPALDPPGWDQEPVYDPLPGPAGPLCG
jgi:hypothetical protein